MDGGVCVEEVGYAAVRPTAMGRHPIASVRCAPLHHSFTSSMEPSPSATALELAEGPTCNSNTTAFHTPVFDQPHHTCPSSQRPSLPPTRPISRLSPSPGSAILMYRCLPLNQYLARRGRGRCRAGTGGDRWRRRVEDAA